MAIGRSGSRKERLFKERGEREGNFYGELYTTIKKKKKKEKKKRFPSKRRAKARELGNSTVQCDGEYGIAVTRRARLIALFPVH